jgi:hypothetical protein
MTCPELIANVLENLRQHYYTDDAGQFRAHEYKRDERQLIRAIATYGAECNQRGWHFQADFIYQDLMQLLLTIRTSGADIQYVPIYLAGAIRRHLGQRAEELSAQAKTIAPRVTKLVAGLTKVEAIRQPTDVEIFAEVYAGIGKIQRARKAGKARNSVRAAKQEELL